MWPRWWVDETIWRHQDEQGWREQQAYRRKMWASRMKAEADQADLIANAKIAAIAAATGKGKP